MPKQDHSFRWGILGPGKIARKFAAGLPHCAAPARVEAVGSRSLERARAFAADFGAQRAYGSYEELAADEALDAIYIATPHTEHARAALLCLEHGRNVLVEKPFTVNAEEASRIIETARSRKLFCMEAMWTRFFPATRKLRELVNAGAIGSVRMIMADFGYRAEYDPASRLFDPMLGGGGLLDVGIYPVSLACMLLGTPVSVAAQANLALTGVDDAAAMLLKFSGGAIAVLSCATQVDTPHQAVMLGETGALALPSEWWKPDSLTLDRPNSEKEVMAYSYPGTGFQFEADEVHSRIAAGQLESSVMPLDETLMLMRTLDAIRQQIGVAYPSE